MEAIAIKDIAIALGLLATWIGLYVRGKKRIADAATEKTNMKRDIEAVAEKVATCETRLNRHSERDDEISAALHEIRESVVWIKAKMNGKHG